MYERVDGAGKGLDLAPRADRFAIGETDGRNAARRAPLHVPMRDVMPPYVARCHEGDGVAHAPARHPTLEEF